MRKRKALFLVLDALRYDTVSDPVARRWLVPNLAQLIDCGFVRRVVTNAQSTQFVMPSLFSLTYPLDHGGYNTGIRVRPKSFVEVLKVAGWETYKLVTVNQLGVHHGYERGFDTVRTATDFRVVLEHHLDRTLSYEIGLWKKGERSQAEAVSFFQEEFGLLLDQIERIWDAFDHSLWTWRLRRINRKVALGIAEERHLVREDPLMVMNKVAYLSGGAYWRFLGDNGVNRLKRFFWHGVGFVTMKTRRWIGDRTFPPFFLYTHFPLVMPDVIGKLCEFVEDTKDRQWFAYMHFMDIHDCRSFNRALRVLARWRFLPKWWLGRIRGLTGRRFAYDTAMMASDACVGQLIRALKQSGQLDNTVILVTGDHGSFYAENPRSKKLPLGTRTHYEDIEVPLILVGGLPPPDVHGLIDSMGVTATFLDALGVEPDQSFKGVSLYDGGRDAVISESCGHGNADLARRDIHFTITTETHRMMTTLRGSEFHLDELYDIAADPRELDNLVGDKGTAEVVNELYGYLFHERAELLALRDAALPGQMSEIRV